MEQKEILEGNKLIATFMNVYWTDDKNLYMSSDIDYIFATRLEYHTSWDWLMPVYLKITKLIDEIDTEKAVILFHILYQRLGNGDGIEEVYKYIIKFIKLYNTQKQ